MKNHIIKLETPASEWECAIPVGCAKLGAMLYGDPGLERLQLNEERIWSGEPRHINPEGFREKFMHVRKLLLEGKPLEADAWAHENMKNIFTGVSSYETAGDLIIKLGDGTISDYLRELSLDDAVASVSYTRDGNAFRHELFASYPDQLIVLRISSEIAFDCSVSYDRAALDSLVFTLQGLTACGTTKSGGHTFKVAVKLKTDGITAVNDELIVNSATFIEFYIAIRTGGEPNLPEVIDYKELKARHTADFTALMGRSSIELGGDSATEELSCPARLARIKEGAHDPGLVETYFQFGKYLLISSSRGDSLPANLQGVWNGYMQAPWGSDYHTNINLQMNYWHAETANLSECTEPLFNYMNELLLESGKRTAGDLYGCRGTVVHHLSDIYGYTAVADGFCGLWQIGAAWLCSHLHEHWLFTGDRIFLADTAYDFLHESVLFMLDYMFEHDGVLLTGPTVSPENHYFVNGADSPVCEFCLSPAMDVEVIGAMLAFYIDAEKELGRDPETAAAAKAAIGKLPPLKIGKHGQLMEWLEDYDEPEPGHRHISHLFALYPECAINIYDTPELSRAAETTLRRRLESGGGHTGWSCAWLINLRARLGQSEEAYDVLRKLLTQSTRENLLDTHPPFQIDGNFGGCAGIIEMVLQSHCGRISILPALTGHFANGSFSGLMARGGIEVSAKWENGNVIYIKLTASRKASFELLFNGTSRSISLDSGETLELSM